MCKNRSFRSIFNRLQPLRRQQPVALPSSGKVEFPLSYLGGLRRDRLQIAEPRRQFRHHGTGQDMIKSNRVPGVFSLRIFLREPPLGYEVHRSAQADGDLRSLYQKRSAMTATLPPIRPKRSGRRRRMSRSPPRGRLKAVAAGFWQLLNSPSTWQDTFPTKRHDPSSLPPL